MDKEEVIYVSPGIYICNGIVLTQKNEILPFATTWMEVEGIVLKEVSQTEKEEYYMVSLLCGI